jgi:Aldo/keto reductase family
LPHFDGGAKHRAGAVSAVRHSSRLRGAAVEASGHFAAIPMNYRRLGRSGLKVSELSFGSWVTYGNQLDEGPARECMAAAYAAAVNFFDNAEIYARGQSERIMGKALKELGWRRDSYVISTKFFWGLNEGPNEKNTPNRKYLMGAIDADLKAMIEQATAERGKRAV